MPGDELGHDREAREIMDPLVARGSTQDELAEITMELIEVGGRRRESTATFYIKNRDAGNDMRLFRYHASRRVASANRSDTWMGTDFTYEDMTDPKIEQYEYRTLGAERIGDLDCRIIEAIPVAEELR